jgi:hypothetical protein
MGEDKAAKPGSTLIERSGPRWSYSIDTSRGKQCVVVVMKGEVGMDTLDAYYTDIQQVMDGLMGTGKRFCPVVFDITEGYPGNVNLPGMWKRSSEVTPRLGPFVIVNRTNPQSPSLKDQFVESITIALPKLFLATSMEDGFRKLNIPYK